MRHMIITGFQRHRFLNAQVFISAETKALTSVA